MKQGETLTFSQIRACLLSARGDRGTAMGTMRLSLAHMGPDNESVLCSTVFPEDGFERLGFLWALERWWRTRHLPEQKFRSLRRHTRQVRPQVQQATAFLIIVTRCNATPGLPEEPLLCGGP